MPCRLPGGERLLLLERAAVSLQSSPVPVPAGPPSKEVDALVARLGEVLQLSNPSSPAGAGPARLLLPAKHHRRDRAAPYSSPRALGFFASLHRHSAPPPEPKGGGGGSNSSSSSNTSPRGAKQLCGRGWGKKQQQQRRRRHLHPPHRDPLAHRYPLRPGDEDDPHRLLQQLILSGNLIKEAVRRLQLAASAVAAAAAVTGETSATTGSPDSASSVGSCGEGDASAPAAAASYAVSALQALP